MRTVFMEPLQEDIKMDNVSFLKSHASERFTCSYNHIEIPKSPGNAMEFLSRSWSPSTSDFLQIFPSNNPLSPSDTSGRDDETLKSTDETNTSIIKYDKIKMDSKHSKTLLRGTKYSITTFMRSQKEKKKEEKRLQTAQLHAALSLTQLAAAIAGISNSLGKQEMSQFRQETPIASNLDMGNVLSSAAALVTNVCAQAAEALGAHRAQVRAAVDSGVAIQTPLDMIAVTATAATCLRGAALLKSRTMTEPLSRIQEMLKMSAEICIIMPSGRKEWTRVSVYLKQYRLMFCCRKKYFGGALTYPKEYQVTNITEERMEHQGNSYLLCLKTKNGVIKLIFEDEMQSKIWVSTIINLLQMKKPLLAKSQSYSSPFSLLSPTM